jgi:antitoxin component YwqK of YwqJK toxin-antitoxin module
MGSGLSRNNRIHGKKGSKRGLLIGAGLVAATVVIGVIVYLPLPVSDHPNDSKVDNLANAEPPDSINEVTNAPPETVRTNTPTSSGGPQDPITEEPLPKGLEALKALAEKGDAKAQNKLGEKYYYGRGVEKDYKKAINWYRKAAEQGNDSGQTMTGVMYRRGWGVEEDDEEAVKWFRKAAEQGHAWGQDNLGDMYDEGEGVEEDDERAVFWYRKAAAQGWQWAQYNLGMMYMKGEGVEKNIRQAYLWYSLAAEQDDEDSKKRKKETAGQLTSEDIKKVNQWTKQWSVWKLARGWPENPQASEGPFAALEKKFGFRVHYEGDDIFTGDPNREDNPAKPIEPDELNRLPGIMEKALAKYPPWVVQKYLHRVRWVEDLFLKGENVEGAADHPTRSFYVEVSENNESYSDIEVEVTFHHEFAHILDEEFPFPKEAWRACNPEGFIYKEREDDPGKELWGKGFVSNYAQSEIDEDFCELTGLIFAQPRKARLLIDNFPRLQAKYRLWLKFYQKIDPDYFTEERFFPEGLIDPDLPHPELVSHDDLVDLNGTYLYLPTGRPYSARALEYRDKKKTKKKYETLYRDGKGMSTSWYFYKDGKLKQIDKYKDGKRISDIYFHSNGQKSERHYENDKLNGLSTWWDKEGKLEHKDKYQDSKRISSIFFHPNGEKRREQYYKNGKVDGIVTRWHDNGQKAYGATYRDGKQIEPTVKRWNRDGSPKTLK